MVCKHDIRTVHVMTSPSLYKHMVCKYAMMKIHVNPMVDTNITLKIQKSENSKIQSCGELENRPLVLTIPNL